MKRCFVALLTLVVMLTAMNLRAEQITIAVASNFTSAMKDIVTLFEQQTGHKLKVAYGSSGKFFAQIQHHAPFQVFFSADQAKPIALEKAGLAVPGTRFTYAEGALVLWSRKDNFVDEQASVLQEGTFNKLSMANPKLAPYGAAAIEVLDKLNLTEKTRKKWVRGENISQTYQFVATGNADLGFVALSQVMNSGVIEKGSYWKIPADYHQPIRQDAVLLTKGQDSAAALALLKFMKSEQALSIIQSYGYRVNESDQ